MINLWVWNTKIFINHSSHWAAMHSATGCSIYGTYREWIFFEILLILKNFKPKKITILAIFIRKIFKNSQNCWFLLQIILIWTKIKIYFPVPQIDHPVALWTGLLPDFNEYFASVFIWSDFSPKNMFRMR